MLGPLKLRLLDRPVGKSIEELVAADHFYRHLAATLDPSFVRTWVQDLYADRGRPSIDPVVFFRLQLVMFFEGIRSERQLLRVAADRLSIRWYLGYDFDDPLPDHSSLTRIRSRLGLPIFQRFFERVVELCQQAGLVWGKELIFDATKVRANADVDSLVPRWYANAKVHPGELFADDAAAEPVPGLRLPASHPRTLSSRSRPDARCRSQVHRRRHSSSPSRIRPCGNCSINAGWTRRAHGAAATSASATLA